MEQLDGGVSGSLSSKSKYFAAGRIKPLPVLDEDRELAARLSVDEAGEPHVSGSSQPRLKKRNASEFSGLSNPPSKKKGIGRPYAPPETYAHLAHLPDHLKDNLDGKPQITLTELDPHRRSL